MGIGTFLLRFYVEKLIILTEPSFSSKPIVKSLFVMTSFETKIKSIFISAFGSIGLHRGE